MLVQCFSEKGIASRVVILGETAMKMVILGKVIAIEKSSARLIYPSCFGKCVFLQAASETVLSTFELLRIYWADGVGNGLKTSCILEMGVVLELLFCTQLFRLPRSLMTS